MKKNHPTQEKSLLVDYGTEECSMVRYQEDGTRNALALDNRSAIRFDEEGRLDPFILQSYSNNGFYIFEGIIKEKELQEIEKDLTNLLDHAPVTKGARMTQQGGQSFNSACRLQEITWVKPLSDEAGGTSKSHGRHPVKMFGSFYEKYR